MTFDYEDSYYELDLDLLEQIEESEEIDKDEEFIIVSELLKIIDI